MSSDATAPRRPRRLSAVLHDREAVQPLDSTMIGYEHSTYDERRYRLRHGLNVELPGGPPR